jgi:hypothetical protein
VIAASPSATKQDIVPRITGLAGVPAEGIEIALDKRIRTIRKRG